ncbi:MAG: NnrU family protein [Ghiorsea sp.]
MINWVVASIWLYTLTFGLLHSLTATERLKLWIYKQGVAGHHYRLIYSIFGLMTTGVWLMLIYTLPDDPFYQLEGFSRYVLYFLQFVGITIALSALIPIDGAVFLGLKKPKQQTDPFVIRGIYQYIRHPMYAGAMMFLLAKPDMSVNNFHFALAVSIYFIVGSRFEEKRMLKEHPKYVQYQQQVGAFIPKLRL